MRRTAKSSIANNGFSMIEVLVSLLIVGIALCGFIMQALQTGQRVFDTTQRLQARLLAEDLIERIRSNPLAWPGAFTSTSSAKQSITCTPSNPCSSPAIMAAQDVGEILALANQQLPDARVQIHEHCSSGSSLPCIVVAWNAASTARCDNSALSANSVAPSCVLLHFMAGS